jgi:hypothetical protein
MFLMCEIGRKSHMRRSMQNDGLEDFPGKTVHHHENTA